MLTPRGYISFSQMAMFEMSPEKYVEKYIYGKKERITQNMKYGSDLAEGLEDEESTGDPLLDLVMVKLPKYERMDKVVEDRTGKKVFDPNEGEEWWLPLLANGKDDIPILAKPDSAKQDYTAFYEYKTSVRPWNQKMADESGQITFYATAIWLANKGLPEAIELINVPLYYDAHGKLQPTGDLVRLPTKRTTADMIKMTGRIRKAWAGIKELCKNELL